MALYNYNGDCLPLYFFVRGKRNNSIKVMWHRAAKTDMLD